MMPIGTGNELSRCLGWGNTVSSAAPRRSGGPSPELEQLVRCCVQNKLTKLDLWAVRYHPSAVAGPAGDGTGADAAAGPAAARVGGGPARMACFMSIGFDADIANSFQTARSDHPELFSQVWVNKGAYAWFGVKKLVTSAPPVAPRLTVLVDGKPVRIPPSAGTVQVFNCHSSGDGVDFWGTGQPSVPGELASFSAPTLGDGLLEVVATDGVGHLVAARLGVRHAHRLAQGREVVIRVHPSEAAPLCAQIDGESWQASEGEIRIGFEQQVEMVVGPHSTRNVGL